MTLEEILSNLERLKELTNDSGKGAIEGIKAGVKSLIPAEAYVPNVTRLWDETAPETQGSNMDTPNPFVKRTTVVPKSAFPEVKAKRTYKRKKK